MKMRRITPRYADPSLWHVFDNEGKQLSLIVEGFRNRWTIRDGETQWPGWYFSRQFALRDIERSLIKEESCLSQSVLQPQ